MFGHRLKLHKSRGSTPHALGLWCKLRYSYLCDLLCHSYDALQIKYRALKAMTPNFSKMSQLEQQVGPISTGFSAPFKAM